MKVTVLPIVTGTLGTIPKGTEGFVKGTEGFGNKRTSGDHISYNIVNIDQNTMKSPGNLLSLNLQRETIRKRWCENSQKSEIVIIIIHSACR